MIRFVEYYDQLVMCLEEVYYCVCFSVMEKHDSSDVSSSVGNSQTAESTKVDDGGVAELKASVRALSTDAKKVVALEGPVQLLIEKATSANNQGKAIVFAMRSAAKGFAKAVERWEKEDVGRTSKMEADIHRLENAVANREAALKKREDATKAREENIAGRLQRLEELGGRPSPVLSSAPMVSFTFLPDEKGPSKEPPSPTKPISAPAVALMAPSSAQSARSSADGQPLEVGAGAVSAVTFSAVWSSRASGVRCFL